MQRVRTRRRGRGWPQAPFACLAALLAVLATGPVPGCAEGAPDDGVPSSSMPALGSSVEPVDERVASRPPSVSDDAEGTAAGPLIVFLGDSLTAGYGLPAEQSFPAVIGRSLRAAGVPARIANAGISGDTSAGGLSRLDWVLREAPDVVVVALGGNDGLRGQPPESTRANLAAILRGVRAAGAAPLLLGLRMPPNYGPEYTERFAALYAELAQEYEVPLVPFFLEGVAGRADLMQPDGLHPNAEGQQQVAENVLPALRALLEQLPTEAGGP